MLSVIVIKSHLVNLFNNNWPNSKQTLILPVHIKSQLSYVAVTDKFCIRKLYNLWKNSKKARLKKSTRKMRMVSRSWQNCLDGPQNCPQGRGFCLFFAPWPKFRKKGLPGGRKLDYLKRIPRGSARGGEDVGAWNWLMHKQNWYGRAPTLHSAGTTRTLVAPHQREKHEGSSFSLF